MKVLSKPNGYEVHAVKGGTIIFFLGGSRLRNLEQEALLTNKEITRIVKNSINGALILLRNEIVRMAKRRFNVRDEFLDIKRKIHIRKSTARNYFSGSLFVYSQGRLPLVYYLPANIALPDYAGIKPALRQPKGGLPVKVYKDEPAKIYKGDNGETPFLAELKAKYKYSRARPIGMFYRWGKDNYFKLRKRKGEIHRVHDFGTTDISELFAPAPINIVFDKIKQREMVEKANELLDYKINNLINSTLEKKLGRR